MGSNEMTEREMLEFAAKATFGEFANQMISAGWSPLTDDGNAMRLVIELSMRIRHVEDNEETWCAAGGMGWSIVRWDGNKAGATRLAIVRAAAEVGKRMA